MGRGSSGESSVGAGDDSATAGEPQSLRRLEDVLPSDNDSTLAVWGDPEDREELNLTTAQEQNYVIWWRFREEARIQGASQSQVPCPCHYAAVD